MGAAQAAQPWDWPAGCLDKRPPKIEVFVRDEDTGRSAWVPAVPQARITDDRGRNTHLCAEYPWNGERFVEDFPPDRVRLRGQVSPVSVMLQGGTPTAASDSTAGEPEASDWQSWFLGGTTCAGRRDDRGSLKKSQNRPPAPEQREEGPALCDVCMDAVADAVLVPCLHGGLCRGCAKQISENRAVGGTRCPVCRTAIEGFVEAGRPQRPKPPPKPPPACRQRGQEPWRWPEWSLSRRPSVIEVYVGSVQGDRGRWVAAVPRSRIVDETGHDRYLCAEYSWEGERFVEDFEPDRVRKRGMVRPVSELVLLR